MERKSYLIYPDSCWKAYFDLFIVVLLIFSCNLIPVLLAFQTSTDAFGDEVRGWTITNLVIDFMFLVDIVLLFFTVLVDEELNLIEDMGQIAKSYLLSWFVVDFVSIIPIELLIKS